MQQLVIPENKRKQMLQFKRYNQKFKINPVNLKLIFRDRRPGTGLGLKTEPRKEAFIGCVDRRLTLKGYIGGVKKRESAFADKQFNLITNSNLKLVLL